MRQNNLPMQTNPSNTLPLLIVGTLSGAFLAILAYWGGLPPAPEMPKFIIGIGLLLAMTTAVCGLGWFLLFRPVTVPIVQRSPFSTAQRQIIGMGLIISVALEGIGGNWDEAWHARYGIPFGKDFFWRPHILIYIGLLSIIVLAGLSWVMLVRNGKGNWVQRFRGDPVLGVLILTGLFLLFAVPADPIWHSIYGDDISAFSIPHVLLTLLFVVAFLVGAGLMLTPRPEGWQSLLHFKLGDTLPLLAFVFLLLVPMTMLTANWYSLTASDLARDNLVLRLPEWVLPVFVLFLAALVGTLVNAALRYFGTATLVGVVAVALRLLTVSAFSTPNPNASVWLLCLPSLIVIDLIYIVQANRKQAVQWWMAGLAAAVGNVFALPLINSLLIYPRVSASTLPGMVVFPTLIALFAAGIGTAVGNYLALRSQLKQIAPNTAVSTTLPGWAMPIVLIGTLIFLALFVMTAVPPTWAS